MRKVLTVMGLALTLPGAPAFAHPHMFVDTGIEVIFDADRRATGVRISWSYDDLTSLSLLADKGLDPDGDGRLTEAELATLSGFDMHWDAGYPGDTYALLGDQPLGLSGPSDWTAGYDGTHLLSSHYRSFPAPVDPGALPLLIQSYDPSFYTSYSVVTAGLKGGEGCKVQIFEPDRAAADKILQDAIAEMAGGDGVEGEFPAVGAAYAEEARVTCGARP